MHSNKAFHQLNLFPNSVAEALHLDCFVREFQSLKAFGCYISLYQDIQSPLLGGNPLRET